MYPKMYEYKDGPWATEESDSCLNFSSYDPSAWPNLDADGYWHFPEDEAKQPIQIEPLKQGFLVEYVYDLEAARGFTNRVDVAEWFLEWPGLIMMSWKTEIVRWRM